MPLDFIELGKLLLGLFLFIIPGYFWSFLFFKNISRLERIVFGFVLTVSLLILVYFTLDIIFKMVITSILTIIIYLSYLFIILYYHIRSIIKNGIPQQTKELIVNLNKLAHHPIDMIIQHKTIQIFLLLFGVLVFSAFMGFLPHFKENYFLPFHVDEWIHWTYSKSFIETGLTSFNNPYLGNGIIQSLEPGFNYLIGSMAWIIGMDFNTLFLFMPTIIVILSSLAAFNLGHNNKNPFGLEAAFCITVIPTTCRMLGPSFFVPVSIGLFYLMFLLWFLQLKKTLILTLFIPIGLWVIFLIHPPSALAGMIITFIYSIMLLINRTYKQSIIYAIYSLLPIIGALLLSARYGSSIQQVINAFFGGKYFLAYDLPQIWVSFDQMGIIIWILALIGLYFSFNKGLKIVRTIGISSIAFIIIIGLYDKLGYGLPIMYERSFMYLFLMITLMAGWGLAELRRLIYNLDKYFNLKDVIKWKKITKYSNICLPFVIIFFIFITIIPAHNNIGYYHLINETEYETFNWIKNNMDNYENNMNIIERGVIDPYKASPFSAITRLYIVSSTMHPIEGYENRELVNSFLNEDCTDTSFLDEFNISIIYAKKCFNQNLTEIYPNVYIYSIIK